MKKTILTIILGVFLCGCNNPYYGHTQSKPKKETYIITTDRDDVPLNVKMTDTELFCQLYELDSVNIDTLQKYGYVISNAKYTKGDTIKIKNISSNIRGTIYANNK